MNLTYWKLVIASKLLAGHRWKQILKNHGIVSNAQLEDAKLNEIILSIYEKEFHNSNKDKTIRLESLGKTYDNAFKAVHNLNLEIEPKDFVCLLGPSGCGKTTALRMLAGLDTITEGKYMMGNREMNHVHPSDRDTAMVFQNYALYPFMSVYNNVAFGLKLKTYKNIHSRELLKQINEEKKPLINEILDLKHKIYELKNPFKEEMNQMQIQIKKLSKNPKKADECQEMRRALTTKRLEAKKLVVKAPAEITKIKAEIAKLEQQSKALKAKKKADAAKKAEKAKETIAKLLQEEKVYFEKKKSLIPDLVKAKNELSKQQKELISNKLKSIKDVNKTIKMLRKDIHVDQEKIEQVNITHEKEMERFDKLISTNADKLVEASSEISLIKHSKQFQINDIKTELKLANSLFTKALDASVIWKKSIYSRVFKLAKLVGIENYLNRKPSELSGGQRQRIALIRAISKDAQLFLFDEPLSNLDAQLRAVMRSEIRKIHDNSGATSLYVTHDQIEAMTMSNKVVVMNLGYIQQVGHPRDLYLNPSNIFVAKFIGTPPMNILKVAKKKDSIDIFGKKIKLQLPEEKMKLALKNEDEEVVFGIRPQDISVVKTVKAGAIQGRIESYELTGSEYTLDVEINGLIVKALAPNTITFNNNDKVYVDFDTSKSHLFDLKTGVAITSKINAQTQAALKVWTESSEERIANMIVLDANKTKKEALVKKGVKAVANALDKQKNIKSSSEKLQKNAKVYKDYKPVNFDDHKHNITS